jgi:hypothetical protein
MILLVATVQPTAVLLLDFVEELPLVALFEPEHSVSAADPATCQFLLPYYFQLKI